MKINKNTVDNVVYIILNIITLGAFWILRILISVAIRKAFMTPIEEDYYNRINKVQ